MPVSGIVIRLAAGAEPSALSAELGALRGLALGDATPQGLACVVEAADYPTHDQLLDHVNGHPSVRAVDVVFHDFSDVNEFDTLPRRRRGAR